MATADGSLGNASQKTFTTIWQQHYETFMALQLRFPFAYFSELFVISFDPDSIRVMRVEAESVVDCERCAKVEGSL